MIDIRNCIFGFECKADWDAMRIMSDSNVRYCGECKKEVYQVSTKEELFDAIQLNRCVAIFDAINMPGSPEKMISYDYPNRLPRPTLGVPAKYKNNEELDFDSLKIDEYDIPAFLRKNNDEKQ